MNIAKLRKLKRWILAEPRRYRQEWWLYGKESQVVREQEPPCGTAGCLAGNVCLMEGYVPVPDPTNIYRMDTVKTRLGSRRHRVSELAARILGLKTKQRRDLFDGSCEGWGNEAEAAYHRAKTPRGRAKAAAMELDRLIALARKQKEGR